MSLEAWQVFAALGVPGLALGVFYGLNKHFRLTVPRGSHWNQILVAMILTFAFGITMASLVIFSGWDKNIAENSVSVPKYKFGNTHIDGNRNATNVINSDISPANSEGRK